MVEEFLVVQYSYSTSDIINMPASSRGKETVVLLPNDAVDLSPAGDQTAISSYQPPWGKGRGAVGVQSTKFYIERLCPEVQPLTLLYTIFWQKRYAFHIPSIGKQYTFLFGNVTSLSTAINATSLLNQKVSLPSQK